MPPTISFSRGDVILVGFTFSDETGLKRRPALIVSSARYHRSRKEAIIAAITSNVRRLLLGDHLIRDWQAAGLLYPSVVTRIIRTIKQSMIERKLGSLPQGDMQAVDGALRLSLSLP